jgi:drug/metabolite transporter (DMT)-like permease
MTIIYGLLCAVFYGVADFSGGRASRLASSVAITVRSQLAGFAFLLCVLPFIQGDGPTTRAFVAGGLGGICGAIGLILLYRALSLAAMSVVSPITAVLSAVVPVTAGLILGEGLSWPRAFGVTLALVAVGLISRGGDTSDGAAAGQQRPSTSILLSALFAGVFFGLFVVALDRAGDSVGVWPLVAAKPTGIAFAITLATQQKQSLKVPRGAVPLAVAAGFTDMAANVFATLSTQAGQVAIAGVLVSLYPASTVALARIVDRELITRIQIVGFAVAIVALGFIAM